MGACCGKEANTVAAQSDQKETIPSVNQKKIIPSAEESSSIPTPRTTSKPVSKRVVPSSQNTATAKNVNAAIEERQPQASMPTKSDGPQEPPPGWGDSDTANDDSPAVTASGTRSVKHVPDGNGYIGGTRKNQEISSGVGDRIKGLEECGLQTKRKGDRRMLTPRIITDVKETWDKEGNITREMTHYIEEPDGTKRTERETVYIAADEADPAEEEDQ